ncbi:MAG: hypothetical protein PHH77_05030 [Victivallaceae bacterium]|nr:hypothetical protein [Victivallaceae bacterium]
MSDQNSKSSSLFHLPNIISIVQVIVLIILTTLSWSITKKLELRHDADNVLQYSSNLEKSYRAVRNCFEWIEFMSLNNPGPGNKGTGQNSRFQNLLDQLDSDMVIFFHKATIICPGDNGNYEKIARLDSFYWQGITESKYSFREFLRKQYELSLLNEDAFLRYRRTRAEVLLFFDDLMHLAIIQKTLAVHTDSEAARRVMNDKLRCLQERIRKSKQKVEAEIKNIYELIYYQRFEKI